LGQKDRTTYTTIKRLWRKNVVALKEEHYPD